MSGHEQTISDQSLNQLMRYNLLFGEEEAIKPILDMESTYTFAQDISFLPTLPGEAKLMRNLASRLGRAMRFKLFLAGLAVSAGLGIYAGSSSKQANEPVGRKPSIHLAPPAIMDDEMPVPPPGVRPPAPSPWAVPFPIQSPGPMPAFPPSDPEASAFSEPADTGKHKSSAPFQARHTIVRKNKVYKHAEGGLKLDTLFDGITRLEVDGGFCNIVVRPGKGDRLTKIKATALAEFKGVVLKQPEYYFACEKNGNTLKIGLYTKGPDNLVIVGSSRMEGLMEFEIPKNMDVVLKNSSGDIDIKGITSSVCELRTSYGDIFCDQLNAPVHIQSSSGNTSLIQIDGNIDCKTSYGDQDFQSIDGDVKTASGSGNLHLADVNGKLDILSGYGDIDAQDIYSDINVKSSSGYTRMKDIHGKYLAVDCSYGDIWLDNAESEVKFRSSSGNIKVTNNKGKLDIVSTYGYVMLKDIQGDARVKANSGNVNVQHLTGDIDFVSSYGDVDMDDCQGNMSITVTSGHIIGHNIKVADKLTLYASYGNIHMKLLNKTDDLSFDLTSASGSVKVNKDDLKAEGKEGKLSLTKGHIQVKAYSSSGNQLFE